MPRGGITQPRLPYAPFARYVDLNCPQANGRQLSERQMARFCDTPPSSIDKWRAAGEIPLYAADRAAIAMGTHPAMIWPEWFDIPTAAEPEHGTKSGVYWHNNRGVSMCEACKPVYSEIRRERRERRRAREQEHR